jgi:thioredoxin-like negative regulator of GroEL
VTVTEVPGKYGVMSIPMFLIVNKGEVVDSFVGSKPKEDVVAKLKAVLPQ